jgi:hypothetical protein
LLHAKQLIHAPASLTEDADSLKAISDKFLTLLTGFEMLESDMLHIVYIIGAAIFFDGSVRHANSLKEQGINDHVEQFIGPYPGKRLKRFALMMAIPVLVGGVVQFKWWSPLVAYGLAFVAELGASQILRTQYTPILNKILIVIGFVVAAAACISNQLL